MMKFFVSIVLSVCLLSSCASSSGWSRGSCSVGKFDANGQPCWVNNKPTDGVVLSMSQHVDPNKTREVLFKKALIELAAISGVEVSEDSIVKKKTTVTGNDNVSARAQVVSLATVKTAKGSVTVKAKVRDEWTNPTSRKLYLWVVPVK